MKDFKTKLDSAVKEASEKKASREAKVSKVGRKLKELKSSEEIIDTLSKGEILMPSLDISNPSMSESLRGFDEAISSEDKLHRALSHAIAKQKGFHGGTKIPDMVKELSKDMDIDPPAIEFGYKEGMGGWADPKENKIGLNPTAFPSLGRESLIAHELRHIKEAPEPSMVDKSLRSVLYAEPTNPLQALHNYAEHERSVNRLKGKALNNYLKIKDRLFEGDKLKHNIDILELYDFLEKDHFDKSFLKENLKRLAKGLPIIGGVAALLSGEDVSAAAPVLDAATSMDYDKSYDPSTVEYQERMNNMRLMDAILKRRGKK